MTVTQRVHVFNLVVIALALTAFLAAVPRFGFSRAGGLLGFMGFLGFGLVFYWGGKNKVVTDERDRAIGERAARIGFAIFWVLFVLGCVGTWWILGDNATIPVRLLPVIMYLAWAIWQGAMSTAVLIQYRQAG
jgi:uncharacterized membrane protein